MSSVHDSDGEIVVANEFAAVSVRKIQTRNGERLQIRSLGHERSICLDAIALESLTWSSTLAIGRNLETPLGPDPSEQLSEDPSFTINDDNGD